MGTLYLLLWARSPKRGAHSGGSPQLDQTQSFDGGSVKGEELLWGSQSSNFHKIVRPRAIKPRNFDRTTWSQLTKAGYAKRRTCKASLSFNVQQYGSGTTHHVVKSKMNILHVGGGVIYVNALVTLV